MELAERVDPRSTAIVCMEMQRGVVGDLRASDQGALGEAVYAAGIPARLGNLIECGRRAGVQVIYCHAVKRADRKGSFLNTAMLMRTRDAPDHLRERTPAVDLIPELRLAPADLVSERYHGYSPFTGTSLDSLLRAQDIRTIVAAGVSLNRGIVAMTIEGVSRGYHVVVARDCVTGVPAEYAQSVLEHGLAAISTLADAATLTRLWSAS